MGSIVLIVVAAAWVAVLAPPLLRGRQDSRASSSVVDFRRQLSTLQRSAPMRGTPPMRAMARPLAPSPTRGYDMPRGYDVPHGAGDPSASRRRPSSHRGHHRHDPTRSGRRPVGIRQRRQNVIMALSMSTAGSAFIAFTTKSDFFVYLFVFSAMGLGGYCYKLSQMRRYQSGSSTQGYQRDWIRAS